MIQDILLLDVGGTFIKCSDGREIPIDSDGPREAVCAAFIDATGPYAASHSRGKVAVAVPGPFNYREGVFLMKHKFASVYGENFRDLACLPPEMEVRYTHDVNGMLSGEMAFGNGKGYNRVALITLGTGLGFSMSVDGEILMNETGSPLISIFDRPFRDGTLEDYAAMRGFMSAFADNGGLGAETVKDIALLAAKGDGPALKTFRDVALTLSGAIAPILQEYGIECLLFGGQISRSFCYMQEALGEGFVQCSSLRTMSQISDFDNATFNGLRSLFPVID